MRVLIIEDNVYQRSALVSMTKSISNTVETYETGYGKKALEIAYSEDIDIFMIDIELLDMSGLDFAKEIRKNEKYELAYIIFITSYGEYQMEAFKEIHCYDYIEKPYKKEEVVTILDRIYRFKTKKRRESKKSIIVYSEDQVIQISINDIIFIESHNKDLYVHTEDRIYLIKRGLLSNIIEEIDCDKFIRTNKAFIVNMEKIEGVKKLRNKPWEISFKNYEDKAFVGRTFMKEFIEKFERYGEGEI